MAAPRENYITIAAQKQAQRWNAIPAEWRLPAELLPKPGTTNVMDVPLTCGILDKTDIAITSGFDATGLVEELRAKRLTVEQVTIAFCKTAAIAQQLTNCLTEIFFDVAIARAKHLDETYSATPSNALPPLFGLPISLKDSFAVRGHDTSTGLACFANQPATEHSSLARLLLDLGAVLYCKTNLPQTILTGDSDNNLFGRTLNPRNTSFTAGGSTGGEGALLALRGSVLGVGTDLGGSIRVPSVCNGLYGLRPSVGLVPHTGVRDLNPPGTKDLLSSAGPMATSLRDIEMFMRVIMQAEAWRYDPAAVGVPWVGGNAVEAVAEKTKKVRIGVMLEDGVFTPAPPVRRGLRMVMDKLAGHTDRIELVPIELPDVQTIYSEFVRYLVMCGGQHYLGLFAQTGEPPVPSVKNANIDSIPAMNDLHTLRELNARREVIAQKYHALFVDSKLDAILMPPAPHTAIPHDTWNRPAYTCLWNYMDYPALVVPVDKVREGEDEADDLSHAKYGKHDEDVYKLYTGPKEYRDLPICVQLVGYRQRDDALLKVAGVVDDIVHKRE
ncbi:amidase [Microdochium trichocladiopsis]|uniref:Amidase n=1 Tax=Microdochium trichocladiopsis TaxID=1682393 RepID=A0A9P8Y115_9PEZI|nr:amidase [Microdochium trichocladiopsis]KAH7024862.1 amidase [Microdochium trichocladiopsis]